MKCWVHIFSTRQERQSKYVLLSPRLSHPLKSLVVYLLQPLRSWIVLIQSGFSSRDVSPADRSLRHYWGHLYRVGGYNTGARYLEYIFNAFISGRAGTPEIAGRYLAVFQVLISSRSRVPPNHPPADEEGGARLCRLRSFDPSLPHFGALSPWPPPQSTSRWRRPCPPPPTAGSGVTSKTDL